ncbi:hypothetical protein ACF07T_26135 [Streptomyces sp. NPDC015184]|uniref:hypothetical protein n=1 Tax=Streptomyces sp. NPDC015184 TaxID=3364946 RepID=UPI0036FFD39B
MLLDPEATREAVASSLRDLPFPWSGDPVEIVGRGFSNVVLRIGTDVLIRVPRTHDAMGRSEHTVEVLRRLPLLPMAVPEVLGTLPAGPRPPFGAVLLRRLSGVLDWDGARIGPRAADLCGVRYLGRDFAEEMTRAYAARNSCDHEVLHEETKLAAVRRELRGVTWSLRHDDPEELEESLDKVRRSLHEFLLPPA